MLINTIQQPFYNYFTCGQPGLSKKVHSVISKTHELMVKVVGKLALGKFLELHVCDLFPPANTILSDRVIKLVNTAITPIIRLRNFIIARLPEVRVQGSSVNFSKIFVASTLEEIVFRGIIGSVFLKEAPKLILRKIAPQYENAVDHKIAKIARAILTSALFALAHAPTYAMYSGMLIPQFISGLLYSYWQENGASLTELSAIHFSYNAILFFMFS